MKVLAQLKTLQQSGIDQELKDEAALLLTRSEVGLRHFIWSLQHKLWHRLSLLSALLKETVAEKRKRIESDLKDLNAVEHLVQKIDIQQDFDTILPRSLNTKEETLSEHETEDAAGGTCSPVDRKSEYYSHNRNKFALRSLLTSRYSTIQL